MQNFWCKNIRNTVRDPKVSHFFQQKKTLEKWDIGCPGRKIR